jgi:hypothetical protein
MTYHHFYSNLGETLKMCNKVMPKYQMDCILPSVDALTLYIDESLGYELCQYLSADQKDRCIKRWDGVRTYVDTK